jgi:hypothetical protein
MRQQLKQALGAPAARFFDRRFAAIDTRLTAAAATTRAEIARATGQLLADLDTRFQRVALEVAIVSRAHGESVGYVATELARLDQRFFGEIQALREEVLAAPPRQRPTIVSDPYVIQAVGRLEPGQRVLAIGFRSGLAPVWLAAMGYRVTALADGAFPVSHHNLEAVVGALGELAPREPAVYGAAVLSSELGVDDDTVAGLLAAAHRLLAPGALLVMTGTPEATAVLAGSTDWETLDRSAAALNGSGSWSVTREQSPHLVMITAQRT